MIESDTLTERDCLALLFLAGAATRERVGEAHRVIATGYVWADLFLVHRARVMGQEPIETTREAN